MKLVTFTQGGSTRIGILRATPLLTSRLPAPNLPSRMCAFLSAGTAALTAAKQAIGNTCSSGAQRGQAGSAHLTAPKILAVGLNYKDTLRKPAVKRPRPMILISSPRQ